MLHLYLYDHFKKSSERQRKWAPVTFWWNWNRSHHEEKWWNMSRMSRWRPCEETGTHMFEVKFLTGFINGWDHLWKILPKDQQHLLQGLVNSCCYKICSSSSWSPTADLLSLFWIVFSGTCGFLLFIYLFSFVRHNCKLKTSHRSSLLTVRSVPADLWLFLPCWRKPGSPWCLPLVR